MSTAATVKEQLLKLISLSNEATGNEDTDLTTAVMALISSYVKDENGVPVFVADFSGSAPSPSQFYSWEGRDYGGAITDALENISCQNGVAKLISVYDVENSKWTQQMMTTGGLFESDNFICTFRAKFSGLAGSWQNVITYGTGTHWTDGMYSDGVKWPAGGEIDAFEQAGGYADTPNTFSLTAHYGAGTESGYPNTHEIKRTGVTVEFTTDVWHDFKFSLKNGYVQIWIDGVMVSENDFSACSVSNNYLVDYLPFLKPHAFYIDGSCAASNSNTSTENVYEFEVSDFKVYTEKKVDCTGLEIYPQMWEKGTGLVFPTGAELYLDRVYTPANVSNKACTWQSSNPTVATVVQGYVKTIGEGNAVITATCGEVSASYNLTVSNTGANIPCAKVIFEMDAYTVNAGDSLDLISYRYPHFTTEEISITSGDNSVAKASGTTVTGVTAGSATLTVSCGNKSASVPLTVAAKARTSFAEYDFASVADWASTTTVANSGSAGTELDMSVSLSTNSGAAGGKTIKCTSGTLTTSLNIKAYPTLYFWRGWKFDSTIMSRWLNNGTNVNKMPSVATNASQSVFQIRHGGVDVFSHSATAGEVYNIAIYNDGAKSYVYVNGQKVKDEGAIGYITDALTHFVAELGAIGNPAIDYFAAYHNYEFTEAELIAMTQLDS